MPHTCAHTFVAAGTGMLPCNAGLFGYDPALARRAAREHRAEFLQLSSKERGQAVMDALRLPTTTGGPARLAVVPPDPARQHLLQRLGRESTDSPVRSKTGALEYTVGLRRVCRETFLLYYPASSSMGAPTAATSTPPASSSPATPT